MKRTVKYKGIKEIVYVIDEYTLERMALKGIKKSVLYVKSDKPSDFSCKWANDDDGRTRLEITQNIVEVIEKEGTEPTDR